MRRALVIDSTGYFLDSELRPYLLSHPDLVSKGSKVLEIGSFEGMASIFFARELGASVTTVDPFFHNDPHTWGVTSSTERRFSWNVRFSGVRERIDHQKLTSDEFFHHNKENFNFVYLDGSHDLDVLTRDLTNGLGVCERNAVLWIDDYGSSMDQEGRGIADVVDEFAAQNSHRLELIHRGYQLGFRVT